MKGYTSLKQSKKLAEILTLESADMHYHYDSDFDELESIPSITEEDDHFVLFPKDIRCWSLAALLDALPSNLQLALAINDYQGDIKERYAIGSVNSDIYDCYADNPVDACYEMIIRLHSNQLL